MPRSRIRCRNCSRCSGLIDCMRWANRSRAASLLSAPPRAVGPPEPSPLPGAAAVDPGADAEGAEPAEAAEEAEGPEVEDADDEDDEDDEPVGDGCAAPGCGA